MHRATLVASQRFSWRIPRSVRRHPRESVLKRRLLTPSQHVLPPLRLRACMPRAGAVARPQHDAAKGSHATALQLAAELNAAASALNNAPALLSILSTSQDVVRTTRCLLLLNARSRASYALTPPPAAGGDSSRHPGSRRLFHGQAASGAVSAGCRAGWGHRRCSAAHLVSAAARVCAWWWLTPAAAAQAARHVPGLFGPPARAAGSPARAGCGCVARRCSSSCSERRACRRRARLCPGRAHAGALHPLERHARSPAEAAWLRSVFVLSSKAPSQTSCSLVCWTTCCAAQRSAPSSSVRDAWSWQLLGCSPSACNAGALASRYLQHPDVRFYTHTALRRCAPLPGASAASPAEPATPRHQAVRSWLQAVDGGCRGFCAQRGHCPQRLRRAVRRACRVCARRAVPVVVPVGSRGPARWSNAASRYSRCWHAAVGRRWRPAPRIQRGLVVAVAP